MRKYIIIFLFTTAAGIIPAAVCAQNEKQTEENESFEDFRKGVQQRFYTFRKKTLDDYDKYLGGIWQEYNSFRGKKKYSQPKPDEVPIAGNTPQTPVTLTPTEPLPESAPDYKSPEKPIPVVPPVLSTTVWDTFNFYSLQIQIPKIEIGNCPEGISPQDFSDRWNRFSDNQLASKLVPYFKQIVENYGFNDWFAFELIRTYVSESLPSAKSTVRISLTHYLLIHFGFDIRLGLLDSGEPMLMAAINQDIYERSYTVQNKQKYYIFRDTPNATDNIQSCSFSTCQIPDNTDNGKAIDPLFHREMNIPYAPHSFCFTYNGLKIEGEVNANLMPMLYLYPLMNIGCYAKSVISPNVRNEVTKQLKQQLAGLPQRKAINDLLQFVQSAFEYATDEEQHGFEKPYFFEETLFYPQCDCEDRSIFYSYLLWQVLGVENHLIGYPGHECVSVHLDPPIEGTGYRYENKSFFISDPTYIGATTGMCMPDFLKEQPEIELSR